MNSKWEPIELCFGIATGLVAVFNPATVFEVKYLFNMPWLRHEPKEDFLSVIGVIVMFVGPGLLVTIGSYLHTTQEQTLGFVFTIIGGSILVLEFPLLLLIAFNGYSGLVYTQGLAAALYMLLPSPLAALTMIGAFMVRRSLRLASFTTKTLSHKFSFLLVCALVS